MDVRATTDDPPVTGADTIVVGIFDGKGVPHAGQSPANGSPSTSRRGWPHEQALPSLRAGLPATLER